MTVSRTAEQRWLAWQSVDSGRLLLLGVSTLLVVIALVQTAVGFSDPHHIAIAFGLFIAFGELLRLALPGGRETAPIAMSAALAYAMALKIAVPGDGHAVTAIPPLQVIAVAAIGMSIGALPHIAAGRPAGITAMSARLVAVAAVAFIYRPMANTGMFPTHLWAEFIVMAMLAALAWLIETVIAAVIRADDLRARYSVTFWDEVRVQWRLGLAVGVSAIITVLGAKVMGISELVVFAGPLLVIQLAFRRYAGIRATYLQTVRALAQVTEVGGYVESGHSGRVSRLALAVGRELGMSEPDLLNLEYAALMHDIGQLSLPGPIPGGATVLVSAADQQRIADFGAEVIRHTGVLETVADLVSCQSMPCRGGVRAPPLGSRIIRAANAFDDLVGGSADRDRIGAALERLRMDTDTEYDPGVVAALAMVTGRLPVSRL
ncbi:MAG TPA: HD domain-containing protein [Streptosporangiaceae bacterium]|nr:HD domain-containing protein [Streptosporangiaceae bacterium]